MLKIICYAFYGWFFWGLDAAFLRRIMKVYFGPNIWLYHWVLCGSKEKVHDTWKMHIDKVLVNHAWPTAVSGHHHLPPRPSSAGAAAYLALENGGGGGGLSSAVYKGGAVSSNHRGGRGCGGGGILQHSYSEKGPPRAATPLMRSHTPSANAGVATITL